jgi:hypothetical protein
MLKPDDLQGVDYNPRRMSPEAFDGLKASARTLGDISGICYNKRTGRVFAGIHRVKALKEEYGDDLRIEGADDTPVLVCPARKAAGHRPETPEFRFNIRVVDWPEDLERLANVTANNPHIQGVFDENLEDILGQIGNDFADGLAEDLRIPDLDLDMVIGKTGTGGPGKEGASPAVKPGRPPAPEIHGDDDRSGRFLLVYTSPKEKAYWCNLLGLPEETDRVVITVDEMKEHQEADEGEQEPDTEAGEGDADGDGP